MSAARAACLALLAVAAGAMDVEVRQALQHQVIAFGVVCEDMCKKVQEYPNCACPGFGGTPADDDDTRSCAAKYCHPPVEPCPNDPFFNCVGESTKLLQVATLPSMAQQLEHLGKVQTAIAGYAAKLSALAPASLR